MADDEGANGGEEPQYDRLTNRSKQVLRHVGQGLTSKEIAQRLGIHPITVNGHVEKAMRRLGVSKRLDAARLLALHEEGGAPPTIPAQRPAAITTIWRGGLLDVAQDLDLATDRASIEAALTILREALEELCRKLSTENVSARDQKLVRDTANSIPDAFPTMSQVFRLGYRYDVLAALADVAGEEWSSSTYSEYVAMCIHYERLLKQFPAWTAFLSNARTDEELSGDLPQAAQAVNDLVAALQDNASTVTGALATPNLLAELKRMDDAVDASESLPGLSRISWRTLGLIIKNIAESVGNILKAITEAAVGYLKVASNSFRRELDKQAELDGAKAFQWLRRVAALGLLGSGTSALGTFIAAHPDQFTWLGKVIGFIVSVTAGNR